MESDYRFTMSPEDQEKFINICRTSKYGELLRTIKSDLESQDKQVNFKEQSSSKFVLSRIDIKIMKKTCLAFPIDLPLNDRNIYTTPKSRSTLLPPPEEIYDVRFIMPLIYHSVSPSLFVDCRDFIAKRCLALTLVGLASEDLQMRALCYSILERYYEHLLGALLIDKKLWLNLLDIIKNSIPAPNARLRFVFTTFIARLIDILLHPSDKMYELVKEFLAGRPTLQIDTIEIYDDLLLCSDVDMYDNNLRWLVTLFRDGVQSQQDLKVLIDLNVIPQLMCLYNSELRFARANEAICSVLINVATVNKGSIMLVSDYSFLPWLHQVILMHINQPLQELKADVKSESLADITKGIASLIFALVDNLLRNTVSDELPLPRLFELINVFIELHDLVIKSKNKSILGYYLNYVKKVAKATRKDNRIPDQLAGHLLELIRAKMPYLAS